MERHKWPRNKLLKDRFAINRKRACGGAIYTADLMSLEWSDFIGLSTRP